MRIQELYKQGSPVISFEVFPPKKDADVEGIFKAVDMISGMSPDFISVTYGAGGGGNKNMTAELASFIQKEHGVSSIAHLTCIDADRERMLNILDGLESKGVGNVLALRGDVPKGMKPGGSYRYAEDLIRDIRSRGGFCIGGACYPEGHIECDDPNFDIEFLRRKQDAGADFFITQLFFDNNFFFRFLERAKSKGIKVPISAGVMPILGRAQIERMIFLCGASLPSGIIKLLHKYENNSDDLRRAGIEYAAKQIDGLLAQKADGVHIYTMNKPDIAEYCMKHIGRL